MIKNIRLEFHISNTPFNYLLQQIIKIFLKFDGIDKTVIGRGEFVVYMSKITLSYLILFR